METAKPQRRRTRRPKPENYYQILGVRANADSQLIKQQYIAAVKAFPPETHPEEFQRIRRAYETLRDPVKRQEYDLLRKYGGRLEKMMEEAWRCIESGRYDKAEGLVRECLKLTPGNTSLLLVLAQLALFRRDQEAFQARWEDVERSAAAAEKPYLLAVKARMLLETDYPEEALETLEEGRGRYPEMLHLYLGLYSEIYLELDREEDLWRFALSVLPPPGQETASDLHLFIFLLNTMIEVERWSAKSTIQQRVRKLLKTARGAEEKAAMADALWQEHDEYLEAGRFREAELYIDFLHYLQPADPKVQAQRRQTQELMRLEKELKKLRNDGQCYPAVTIQALEWLYTGYWSPEDFEDLRSQLPSEFQLPPGTDPERDEMFAQGIMRLRKNYPLLYCHFQEQWDELLQELLQNLNRETRRQIRFGSSNNW